MTASAFNYLSKKHVKAPAAVENPSTIHKPKRIKFPEKWHVSYGPFGTIKTVEKSKEARPRAGLFHLTRARCSGIDQSRTSTHLTSLEAVL